MSRKKAGEPGEQADYPPTLTQTEVCFYTHGETYIFNTVDYHNFDTKNQQSRDWLALKKLIFDLWCQIYVTGVGKT